MKHYTHITIGFRPVLESDLDQILSLYTYYVLHSTATFHTVPPSAAEMRRILNLDEPAYASYVIYDDAGRFCGYVLYTAFIRREACRNTAEVTLYLKPDCTGMGIGGQAMRFIETEAQKHQMNTLIALVTSENEPSLQLFRRCGFTECAHYHRVAEKFGRPLDLLGLEKHLSPSTYSPM